MTNWCFRLITLTLVFFQVELIRHVAARYSYQKAYA